MPNATVSNEPKKLPLKTLEGGEVTLKRMSYGDWLTRSQMAIEMKAEQRRGQRNMDVDITTANKKVTAFEFAKCIVDHNLEDEAGNKLDFNNAASLDKLDPRVGNEIGQEISDMHEFNQENFT